MEEHSLSKLDGIPPVDPCQIFRYNSLAGMETRITEEILQ